MWKMTYTVVKRLVVLVLGLSVLAVGAAMIVLPGPAFIVIPAGLAILATEFAWARHVLHKMKEQAMRAQNSFFNNKKRPARSDPTDRRDGAR